MYLRIKRKRFDELPDAMVAAATRINAPMAQQTTGLHLTVVYVMGGQLTAFARQLKQAADHSRDFLTRTEFVDLLVELNRCSNLFVVSTTVELILASDRSPDTYRPLQKLYGDLAPVYEDFNNECVVFIKGLQDLPA